MKNWGYFIHNLEKGSIYKYAKYQIWKIVKYYLTHQTITIYLIHKLNKVFCITRNFRPQLELGILQVYE